MVNPKKTRKPPKTPDIVLHDLNPFEKLFLNFETFFGKYDHPGLHLKTNCSFFYLHVFVVCCLLMASRFVRYSGKNGPFFRVGFWLGETESEIKSKIITRPLDVWIKKTRDERGFGGKSLILERIPTLSHTQYYLFFFFLKNTKRCSQ